MIVDRSITTDSNNYSLDTPSQIIDVTKEEDEGKVDKNDNTNNDDEDED